MIKPQHHGRRRLPPVVALAVVLLLTGAVLVVGALRSQHHAPQPPASAAVPFQPGRTGSATSTAATPSATAPSSQPPSGPTLRRALPLHLSIPNIGVDTDLLQLGLNPDRTVQVPPLSRHSEAGWYRNSPTPGQLGPSVILGHVDSAEYGPAVFFRLGALRPGNRVSVTRADNTVAVFRVDRVVSYAKDHFPTLTVYGNTDNAALRLITCGGRFDFSTRNYESNIVAYASLVSSHRA
jgi:sortase (surface protein transpeptidase)